MRELKGESRLKLTLWFVVLTVIVIVAAGLTTHHAVLTSQQNARAAGMPIPVQTIPATVQSIDQVIGASGAIEPSMPINIANKVVAKVLRVPVDEGSLVRRGDPLVEFDPQLYAASLASAKASYEHWYKQRRRMESLARSKLASAVDVENAKIAEARARQAVVAAEFNLANTRVFSPVAAVVLSRTVNPGEIGRMDQSLMQLGVLDPVLMDASVTQDKIGYVYIGMPGEVGTDAFPGETFRGIVTKINYSVDPATRTFGVYLRLQNHDLRLKKGVTGYARLVSRRMALAVPSTAIMNPVGDLPTVFVVDGRNRAHLREVRTGLSSGGATEVLSGLQEGEQIVVVGQFGLHDNDQVRSNQNAPWNKS
jgi:membrane fusion protein (multidrug efflux system)